MTGDIAVRRQCNAIQGAIQVKIKMKSLSFLSKLTKYIQYIQQDIIKVYVCLKLLDKLFIDKEIYVN